MHDAALAMVARHVEVAMGRPVDLGAVPDDMGLDSLGLDSLVIVGVLVGVVEECGVDVVERMDQLASPRSVGDLVTIASELIAEAG